MTASTDPWLVFAVGAIYLGARAKEWWEDRDDVQEESDVEAIRGAYVRGEIGVDEMERRLDLALDDRAQQIRERVEEVNGVGPETSAAIAQRFDSWADVVDADRDELEDVHGVGPATAEEIEVTLFD